MTFEVGKRVYRVVDTTEIRWSQDFEGEYHAVKGSEHPVVKLKTFLITKVTAKGAWIREEFAGSRLAGEKKWYSTNTRKVAETPQLALFAACDRRRYHIEKEEERLRLLRARLQHLILFALPAPESLTEKS